jgi:hypothetical protein
MHNVPRKGYTLLVLSYSTQRKRDLLVPLHIDYISALQVLYLEKWCALALEPTILLTLTLNFSAL